MMITFEMVNLENIYRGRFSNFNHRMSFSTTK